MQQVKANKNVIKYTVAFKDGAVGTIEAIQLPQIKVGDVSAVQVKDANGNNVSQSGTIVEIISTEYFNHVFEKCKLI